LIKRDHIFTLPVRVYFQDTDAGGVVYHASYVNFMERSRTEWMRSFGFTNAKLMKELGVVFVVRSLKLDYLKPALLDDLISVSSQLKEVGRSRVTLHQSIIRGEDKLVEAEIHLVSVSLENFKPVRVPDVLREQWKLHL
jgi:acyl-CoA thioester hydrolase